MSAGYGSPLNGAGTGGGGVYADAGPHAMLRAGQRGEPYGLAEQAEVDNAWGTRPATRPPVEPAPVATPWSEKAALALSAITSCYLWLGLALVLPVCAPRKKEQTDGGLCELYFMGLHHVFFISMIVASVLYVCAVAWAVPIHGESVSLAQWTEACRGYIVTNPFTYFHIQCYHMRRYSGNEANRGAKRVVTHAASTEWHCTSSVDESTLPALKAGKTYRVETRLKMFMGDEATTADWHQTKDVFFRSNTRDHLQDKTVQHGIPGLANNLLVYGGSSPPPLYGFGWYILFSVLLLCAPYRLYVYCVTVRADVVFIKRVWRAARGQAV